MSRTVAAEEFTALGATQRAQVRRRFGDVPSYQGDRLAAPELARIARPNALS